MKKACLLISLGAVSFLMAGCATVSYPELLPLTEEDKQAFTCEQVQTRINAAKNTLEEIGEVPTSDKVASGVGIGLAVLRASLGGFNTSDFANAADVKEQADAIEKAQLRLAELQDLLAFKDCPDTSGDAPAPATESLSGPMR